MVNIDIGLKARGVEGRILAISSALETLDSNISNADFDLSDLDVDEITGKIGDLSKELKEMGDLQMGFDFDGLDERLDRLENIQDGTIKGEIDIEKTINEGTSGGSSGGGGNSKGPPQDEDGFSIADFKRQVGKKYGLDADKLDIQGQVDVDELKNILQGDEDRPGILRTTGDLTSEEYPHIDGLSEKNLGIEAMDAGVQGKRNLSAMKWQELQERAGNAGVYPRRADEGKTFRETVESRLRSQRLGKGMAISYDGRRGKVPLKSAVMEGTADVDAVNKADDDSFIEPMLSEIQKRAKGAADDFKQMKERSRVLQNAPMSEMANPANIKGKAGWPGDMTTPDAAKSARQLALEDLSDERKRMRKNRDIGTKIPGIGYDQSSLSPDQNKASGSAFDWDFRSAKQVFDDTSFAKKARSVDSFGDAMKKAQRKSRGFSKVLGRLKPTMGKYMQLLAAVLPVAVALGTQLLGVAAAMGSVALAGGAIMGLGLIGHGESMAASFGEAKAQIRELKQEMFNEVQPLAQQFAPIQSRAFDAIPSAMGGIFEEMEGLAGFEGTLFSLGGALTGGIEKLFAIINSNQGTISDLTTEFGGLFGSGLLNFFEWLIQTAGDNETMMKMLLSSMKSLAIIAYNLSMKIAMIVAVFEPMWAVLAKISGLLNGKFAVGMLASITTAVVLGVIVTKTTFAIWNMIMAVKMLVTFLTLMGGGSIISGIVATFSTMMIYIEAAIAHFSALQLAALSAAAAIAATGIGALAVAGGSAAFGMMTPDTPSGSNMGTDFGGGSKTVYNDNRSYEINSGSGDSYADEMAIRDEIGRATETSEAQELPDVTTSSDGS